MPVGIPNPVPISGLPVAIGLDGTEYFALVQGGVTKRARTGLLGPSDSGGREKLTANRTYYVRSDGSNANDGLEDNAGGAWLTPQHAADYIAENLDLAGFRVKVQIGPGSFGGISSRPYVGGGSVYWLGDKVTPSNVILGNTVNELGFTVGSIHHGVHTDTQVFINGFRLVPTSSPCIDCDPLTAGMGTTVTFADVENFSAAKIELAGNQSGGPLIAGAFYDSGFEILIDGAALTNPSAYHFTLQGTGFLNLASTVTITGTPSFSQAFFVIDQNSCIGNFATFVGSITGRQYIVRNGGRLVQFDLTSASCPGSLPGVAQSQGLVVYTGSDGVFNGTVQLQDHNVLLDGGATQLTNLQTCKHFYNTGATSLASVTLPNAQTDLDYTFVVTDADGIRVNAKSGDTIRIDTSVSASGGRVDATDIGSVVRLRGIDGTQWVATSVIGTWTVT